MWSAQSWYPHPLPCLPTSPCCSPLPLQQLPAPLVCSGLVVSILTKRTRHLSSQAELRFSPFVDKNLVSSVSEKKPQNRSVVVVTVSCHCRMSQSQSAFTAICHSQLSPPDVTVSCHHQVSQSLSAVTARYHCNCHSQLSPPDVTVSCHHQMSL